MPAFRSIPAALAVILTLGACVETGVPTATDVQTGQRLFVSNCAACHGVDAKGGGPASLGLGQVPPDLTLLALQNRGVYPRAYVTEIVEGKVGPDHPTAAMPEFWVAELGQLVTVTSDEKTITVPAGLVAVVNYLETLQE